jgi:hypothetical protein
MICGGAPYPVGNEGILVRVRKYDASHWASGRRRIRQICGS